MVSLYMNKIKYTVSKNIRRIIKISICSYIKGGPFQVSYDFQKFTRIMQSGAIYCFSGNSKKYINF